RLSKKNRHGWERREGDFRASTAQSPTLSAQRDRMLVIEEGPAFTHKGVAHMSPLSSDALVLTCSCGQKMKVAATPAGRQVRCPGCARLLQVPSPTPPAPVARFRLPT